MKEIHWDEISQFDGPEQSPGFLLWQVSAKWRRLLEAALKEVGLTHSQFVLLANVGWLNSKQSMVSQVELARHCRLDVTMTSQVLRTLEKKGFLAREQKEGDERSRFPVVTKSGAKLLAQAIPLVETIDQQFFAVLGKDIGRCVQIFQRLK